MGGPAERIEIRLLGPPEVRVAGRCVEVSRGRAQALLAVLATAAGRPVPADTVAERIWGDRQPADPRGSVYTTVKRLREVLGPGAITSAGGAYTLAVEPDDVDVVRFERLLDEAGPGEAALEPLRSALVLWRDQPYQQVDTGWIAEVERPRLIERYLAATERRVDLEIGSRPAGELVAELTELTTRFPLRESLWLRRIRVLAAAGRRAEALDAYESVRRLLADELGADPGAELRSLYAELRATSTGSDVPRQLPADVVGFTGREGALRRLDELSPRRPVVVLHGAGGVGKTSLAVHWANGALHQFPGGQVFVDLRGFGPGAPMRPAEALLTIIAGLGVPAERIPADVAARTALLRTTLADRRSLIILDNARDEEQLRPLLPGAETMVLVTSRNQLRGLVARERAERIGLDTMPPADAIALLADRLKDHGVAFGSEDVSRLAELCGHLPLALVVAAERAGRYPQEEVGTLAALIGELEAERLDFLETGNDLSTSLRAVMSWSYRALAPDEASGLRWFGAQPLSEIGIAEAVALIGVAAPAGVQLLDRLVQAHLLEQPLPGRFRMHDLVRVYAEEQARVEDQPGVLDVAVGRLARWYSATAINAQAAIRRRSAFELPPVTDAIRPATFADPGSAMAWFGAVEAEFADLMSVASDAGSHHDAAMMATAFGTYFDEAGSPADLDHVLAAGIDAAQRAGNGRAEVDLLTDIAIGHIRRGDLDLSLACLERALELAERIDYPEGRCTAYGNAAIVYRRLGRLDEAIERFRRTLELTRRHAIPIEAAILNGLALTYLDAGRFDEAVEAATQSVRLRRQAGQRLQEGAALDTLGTIHLGRHEVPEALRCFERALAIHRDLNARWMQAHALNQIGRCRRELGSPDQARECWQQSLRIMDEIHADDNVELSRAELRARLADLPPE